MLAIAMGFINSPKNNNENGINKPEPSMLVSFNEDISEGTYYIRSAATTDKYLDADAAKNGEIVTLNRFGDSKSDNAWEVKKVNGPLGGYTIRNTKFSNYYIDADFNNTGNNNCKVQLWKRTGPNGNINPLDGGNPVSVNQEWYIQKVKGGNNKFRIANIKNSQMFLDAKDDGSSNSRLKLYRKRNNDQTQIWVFEKK